MLKGEDLEQFNENGMALEPTESTRVIKYTPTTYQTQGNKAWLFWMTGGFILAFLAFTELGRTITGETAKAARLRIPPAEKWRLPRRERPPARVEEIRVREPELMRDTEVLYEGLGQVVRDLKGCMPPEISDQFGAYWSAEPTKVMNLYLGPCMKDHLARKAKIPTTFGEIGYVVEPKDPMSETSIRLITYGYPTRGKELRVKANDFAEWLAKPWEMVSFEKVR